MTEPEPTGPVPPYASFTTILNQIERMEKQGVPGRIDNTYLTGMAGGTQGMVKHALRSMDLMDENGRTTPRLIALAQTPDERPKLLGELLQERYPVLTGLGLDATRGELDEAIKTSGIGGATARKSASFFVAAATYAGLPISPHIKPTRPGNPGSGTGSGTGTGTRRGTRRKAGQRAEQPSEQPAPTSGKTMAERYFDLLASRAEKADAGEDVSDLFDRMEKLVGLEPTPKANPGVAAGESTSEEVSP